MSGRRYHMMEIVGDPMLVPVLVSDEGPTPPSTPLFRKGEPMSLDPLGCTTCMCDPCVCPPVQKCPQCGQPIVTPVQRKIIYRDRDPRTGKAVIRDKTPTFCSEQCGLHHQYAHEG